MPITRAILASVFSLLLTSVTHAQQCKIKFVIAHWDGKTLQVGLTPEQLKFWNHEKVKRYSIMCLSGNEPDYVIAWSEKFFDGRSLQAWHPAPIWRI